MGERVACTDEVAGSNPAGSTTSSLALAERQRPVLVTDLCRALGGIFHKSLRSGRKEAYDGMEGSVE